MCVHYCQMSKHTLTHIQTQIANSHMSRMLHWMWFVMGKTTKIRREWDELLCFAIVLLLVLFWWNTHAHIHTLISTKLCCFHIFNVANDSSFDWKCGECHFWFYHTTTTVNILWTDQNSKSLENASHPSHFQSYKTQVSIFFSMCSFFFNNNHSEIHFKQETSCRHMWKHITKKKTRPKWSWCLVWSCFFKRQQQKTNKKKTKIWLEWFNLI